MKKIILFATIALVACGQTNNEKTNEAKNADSIKSQTAEVTEAKDYDKLGNDLMKNESLNKLKIELKVAEVIALLGAPTEKSKNEKWEDDGQYYQFYRYPKLGVELDMIGEKESDKMISGIRLDSPCDYKTSKGITIGSTYEEVKLAYKDYINLEESLDSTSIIAGSPYGGMIFHIVNGKVSSIFLGRTAD